MSRCNYNIERNVTVELKARGYADVKILGKFRRDEMDVWKKIPDVNIFDEGVPKSGLCENLFCFHFLLFAFFRLISSQYQIPG